MRHTTCTAPIGTAARTWHIGRLTLLLAITGLGCSDTAATLLALDDTPVSLAITVAPPASGGVANTPEMLELDVGGTAALSATALNTLGAPVGSANVQWSSSNPVVAAVTPEGLVTALEPGSAEISATVDGVEALLAMVVRADPT